MVIYTNSPLAFCEHSRAFFFTLVVILVASINCCGDNGSLYSLTRAT